MATLNVIVAIIVCMAVSSYSAPAPEPGFGRKHEHFIIHVPYKVHTVHHHHVEKVPIYKEIPVIKHVPIYKEVHVPVVKEVHVPVHVHHEHEHHEHKGWSDWY